MQFIRATMKYLRNRQSPAVFYLHVIIILLVLSQLISSNFIESTATGELNTNGINFYGAWIHIITGILLASIALVFIRFVLKAHGFKHYYPYLFRDYSQLLTDIDQLKQRKIPEPEPNGLASIVQGLGLGALLLVLFSGIAWFVFWSAGYQGSNVFKEMHKLLTGLVIAYVIGHGGIGILHILSIIRSQKNH